MIDKPQRAAIYARFSSELQDARSVADQVALCREHAQRQRWTVVQVYADEAVSGASLHGREALLRLVEDAERGYFDIILIEHIDRLARNAADTIRLREQMEFIGIEIHTCASGLVTEMHAGLEGLMSALYLKQLAVHVRRGQAGRVREGLAGGGLTYGYAPVRASAASEPLSRPRPGLCGASSPNTSRAARRAISRLISIASVCRRHAAISGAPVRSMAIASAGRGAL